MILPESSLPRRKPFSCSLMSPAAFLLSFLSTHPYTAVVHSSSTKFSLALAILVPLAYLRFSNFSLFLLRHAPLAPLSLLSPPSSSALFSTGRRRWKIPQPRNHSRCSSMYLPNHSPRLNGGGPSLAPCSITDHSCDVNKGLSSDFHLPLAMTPIAC